MAFEYLDLENKLYIPTKTLFNQIQDELIGLYFTVSQYLIEIHNAITLLGKEWYSAPIITTSRWYEQIVSFSSGIYARVMKEFLPKVESDFEGMLTLANDFTSKGLGSMRFVLENPEQVTVETIESMTESLTGAGNVSVEMLAKLQAKTTEIVELLLDHPIQMIESAYMALLSKLLDSYFEIVSNVIVSI